MAKICLSGLVVMFLFIASDVYAAKSVKSAITVCAAAAPPPP